MLQKLSSTLTCVNLNDSSLCQPGNCLAYNSPVLVISLKEFWPRTVDFSLCMCRLIFVQWFKGSPMQITRTSPLGYYPPNFSHLGLPKFQPLAPHMWLPGSLCISCLCNAAQNYLQAESLGNEWLRFTLLFPLFLWITVLHCLLFNIQK